MESDTSGSMEIEEEPFDHTTLQEQYFSNQETRDLIEFEDIKIEPHYPEPSCPSLEPVIEEEAKVQKQNDKPKILLSTSGEQSTSMEMNPDTSGSMEIEEEPLDHTTLQEQYFSNQETSELIQFEDIKVEPYYPEPSCPSLEPVIEEEAKVQKQNDKPKILLSTSGEQSTSMELEMKIECDDLGIWEDELLDFDSRETGCEAPRKSIDQQEVQNGIGKTYKIYVDLPDHSMFHTKVELYRLHECDICGKAFAQKDEIRKHIMIHTGEKPHKCNVCRKTFTQKGNFKRHMMIHTGEKPYECNVCGKAFRQNSQMKNHMTIHTEEKPYKCDVCGNAFARTDDMKKHMTIHKGEKPHECTVCGKVFAQKGYVKIHMRIHT